MKRIRQISFIIALIVMTIGMCGLAKAEYFPEPTEKPVAAPRVKLMSQTNYTIGNGEKQVLELSLRNVGSSSAERFLMQAVADTESPLSLEILDNSNAVRTFSEGATKIVKLQVSVDKNAKAGTYTISLSHFYKTMYGDNLSETDKINIKVEVSTVSPSILLYQLSSTKPTLTTNDSFSISGILENSSQLDARDLQITLDGLSPDTIYMTGGTDALYFKDFKANRKDNVIYGFRTSSKIKSGTYPITFKIKYKDLKDNVLENSFVFYANVETKETTDKTGYINITKITAPSGTYEVGQNFTINLDIANNGTFPAKNIKITAVTDGDGAIVPKSANVIMIPDLGMQQVRNLTFSFAPTAKSRSQNYVINFKVEYESGLYKDDDSKEIISFEQYAGVNVRNAKADEDEEKEEEAKISKPKIIIENYYADPQIVEAGKEFDLYAVFRNTHTDKKISNIKAVIVPPADTSPEAKGNTFMPVNGSNTFYIDSILPNQTAAKSFRMYTIPDAQPRTYTLEVKFKYEDAKFNEYEESEVIGITVKQTTKLETTNVNVPSEVFVGSPFTLDFTLMNQGKSALNNLSVKVEVEGNFDTSRSFMYFGTMNRYNSGYYDGEITALEPGMHNGKIIISYEDEVGEVTEIEKEFSVNVMDMGGMGMDDILGMIGPDGKPMEGMERPGMIGPDGMPIEGAGAGFDFSLTNPYLWVIIVFVGVVLVAAVIFIRMQIARKRRKFELED